MKERSELYAIFEKYLDGTIEKEQLKWFVSEYKTNPYIKEEYDIYLKIIAFFKLDLPKDQQVNTIFSKVILQNLLDEALRNPELAPFYQPFPAREKQLELTEELVTVRSLSELTKEPLDFPFEDIEWDSPKAGETSATGYMFFRFIFPQIQHIEEITPNLDLELKVFDNQHLKAMSIEENLHYHDDHVSLLHRFEPGLYYWYFYIDKRIVFRNKFHILPKDLVERILKHKE